MLVANTRIALVIRFRSKTATLNKFAFDATGYKEAHTAEGSSLWVCVTEIV